MRAAWPCLPSSTTSVPAGTAPATSRPSVRPATSISILRRPTAASRSGRARSLPTLCARVPAAASTACARYSPAFPSTAKGMYMSATSPATAWTSTKRLPRNTPIPTERLPGPSAGHWTGRCTLPDYSKKIHYFELFPLTGSCYNTCIKQVLHGSGGCFEQ